MSAVRVIVLCCMRTRLCGCMAEQKKRAEKVSWMDVDSPGAFLGPCPLVEGSEAGSIRMQTLPEGSLIS